MTAPAMAGWNLALRFGIEVACLVALGAAGWRLTDDTAQRTVLAITLPLIAVVAWTVFNVPGDTSRSGAAPVVVPGAIRLAVELAVIGGGVVALAAWRPTVAAALGVVTIVHYVASIERLQWLLEA